MRIVLASTSRHRRALMDRLGLDYEAASPACDEDLAPGTDPERGTIELSLRKARSVADRFPGAAVVGADQMAVLDGERLHKPGTPERAVAQLERLAGRTHDLWTGIALVEAAPGGRERATSIRVRMTMRALGPGEAARYVEKDGPLDCCGSYRFESLGASLFEAVETPDPTAIPGLPLMKLTGWLRDLGFEVP